MTSMSGTFPQSAPINAQTPISEVCPRVFQVSSLLTTTEFTVRSIIFPHQAAFFIDAFASASLISAIFAFILSSKRIPFDFQRTSLEGLALDSATSSGLGRAPRSAMQNPIQAPPGTTRQVGFYTS
ncbi:hypothetical protein TNCV_1886891 [Trichonephila clavipes]|nr:hypothetical protein TNCV_1886891 [Trichonephila clavipes]